MPGSGYQRQNHVFIAALVLFIFIVFILVYLFLSPTSHVTTKNPSNDKDQVVNDITKNKSDEQLFELVRQNYSLSQHQQEIDDKIQLIANQREAADLVEQLALDRELTFLQLKKDNLQDSYNKKITVLVETLQLLKQLKNDASAAEYQAVQAALIVGKTDAALILLSKIEAKNRIALGGDGFDHAAQAAYQQGKIAEEQLDYRHASRAYRQAVRYDPENIRYLLAAGKIADNLALYSSAIMYYEAALHNLRRQKNVSGEQLKQLLLKLGKIWESKANDEKAQYYFRQANALTN